MPQLSREMVELALDSHHSILIESFHTKDSDKRYYIGKCVEDIKKVRREGERGKIKILMRNRLYMLQCTCTLYLLIVYSGDICKF